MKKTLREFLGDTLSSFFRNNDVRKEVYKSVVSQGLVPKIQDNYADDTEAAAAGIKLGRLYHTDGVVKIRII